MLTIKIKAAEYFVESKNQFINVEERDLHLEHSLASVAEWESKWKKPFLSDTPKTLEESIDYVRCMTLDKDVNEDTYYGITNTMMDKVNTYIGESMTATWFGDADKKIRSKTTRKETVTAELIYYWMITYNIPMECQFWHLSRLITLIRVFNVKNTPPKKLGKKELMARNRALNEARRKQLNSKG